MEIFSSYSTSLLGWLAHYGTSNQRKERNSTSLFLIDAIVLFWHPDHNSGCPVSRTWGHGMFSAAAATQPQPVNTLACILQDGVYYALYLPIKVNESFSSGASMGFRYQAHAVCCFARHQPNQHQCVVKAAPSDTIKNLTRLTTFPTLPCLRRKACWYPALLGRRMGQGVVFTLQVQQHHGSG